MATAAVGVAQEGGKEAKSVTYEMEMTVSCVSQFVLFAGESNSIARANTPGDRAAASALRQNVIGYVVNY